MIRALATAASGMEAQQTKLDVTANNIANVSTSGFKKSRAEFADMMYQTQQAPGVATGADARAPTGIQIGMGVRTAATQRMHSIGELKQTERPLDVAIQGRGFLQVTMPDGSFGYTRAGSMKVNAEGTLVNADGYTMGAGLTIPPDAQTISIAPTGIVSVTTQGATAPVEVGQMQIATFANPAGLESDGRNIFKETQSSGNAVVGQPGQEGAGTLLQGTVELSNVKVVEEMIDLISGQRAYEVNSRVIRAADEMLQQTASLK